MIALLASILFLFAAAIALQSLGAWLDRRRYPAPGRFIDAAGSRLHVRCMGDGGIPVVLEAGIAASSVSWLPLQRELAKFTRVCAYDRSGLGWSPRSPAARTPEQITSELRGLIAALPRPVVLVGHSFGGLVARMYACNFPNDVAGLVLIDPALLIEWADPTPHRRAMLMRGVRLSRRGAWLARIGFVRFSLMLLAGGMRPLAKLFARVSSGHGANVAQRLVGEVQKLPPELWPVVRAHWCRPSSFLSMAEHLKMLPDVAAEVHGRGCPVPTVVISGGHLRPEQAAEHRAMGDRHVVAQDSGHWVHLDRPDIVVAAVRDLMVRCGGK